MRRILTTVRVLQRDGVPAFFKMALIAVSIAMLMTAGASYAAPSAQGACASGPQPGFFSVPDTISPEWQARLRGLSDPSCQPALPAPDDLDGWRAIQQARETGRMPQA